MSKAGTSTTSTITPSSGSSSSTGTILSTGIILSSGTPLSGGAAVVPFKLPNLDSTISWRNSRARSA